MKRTALIILYICLPFLLHSQEYMFNHIEVKDGLSHNQINNIFKDSRGFMWFSTAMGVDLYDGNNIKVFRSYNIDNGPLKDNYVNDVQEDSKGHLWINTSNGYCVYNPEKNTFNRDVSSLMHEYGINVNPDIVFIDKSKNMWICNRSKGVYLINGKKGMLYSSYYNRKSFPKGRIMNFAQSKDGVLAVYNNGLIVCFDENNCHIKWINDSISKKITVSSYDFFSLFVDKDQDIWIYGPLGLWIYNHKENVWKNNISNALNSNSIDMVRTISQDKDGLIWVGKDKSGIQIYNKKNNKIDYVFAKKDDERSLQNNTITTLYPDNMGTMWVGTYKKGIAYYNETAFKFGISNIGDVNCIEEDKDGSLWLGTNDEGLISWNRKENIRKVYSHAGEQSPSANTIVCLLKSSDDKLWIGTFRGGLDCYYKGKFTHYRNIPNNRNSLANNNVWALSEDKEHNIWIGTLGNGVQKLDKNGNFTTYNTASKHLLSDYVTSIYLTKNDEVIVGTSRGISIINAQDGRSLSLTGTKSKKKMFSDNGANQVFEDSRGLIWIATNEGLNIYDSRKDKLNILSENNGIAGRFITGITEDNNRNIWVTTSLGLTNIMVTTNMKNGENSFSCFNYDYKDGLQNCEFNQRSIKKINSGEILLGGMYGVNYFKPDNLKYNKIYPKVMFVGLSIFNNNIEIGKKYNGRIILGEAMDKIRELKLDYADKVFTVNVSSDNYILPNKVRYLYKLDDFNSDWLESDDGKISFTNLSPGKYNLFVKAVNSDGFVGKESQLKIVVTPPYWLSVWAYIIYGILLIILLIVLRHLILRGAKNKYKMLQLEQESKKIQEVNDMKLRFFTNISHDLKTPLTMILSPIDILQKEYSSDKNLISKLGYIRNNANKLLILINQLLDFRKSEAGCLSLSLSQGDIIEFISNICESFKDIADNKNIHLTFFSTVPSLNISFDRDKMEKIIVNLLSNAHKYNHNDGRIDVSVDLANKNGKNNLEIRIADTGIGITDDEKNKIFERFYQVKHSDMNISGSGVGLSIVKDFVALHNGSINVYDNVPNGSVFIIDIPVTICEKSHLPENIISGNEQNVEKDGKKIPLILIVDDNDDFLGFMNNTLSNNYRIITFNNGNKAWEYIQNTKPDLIISDYKMPGLNGIQLCSLVKKNNGTAHIPFLLLTSSSSEDTKIAGLGHGADELMTKPFNIDVLILKINRLLDNASYKSHALIDPSPSEINIVSLDEKLISKAVKYIEDNISNSDLSVEELSRYLGMSRVHLYKKLLSITGKSPVEFIRMIRLKRAAQYLKESQLNISEIAYKVGFNNPKYFSKYFKEEYNMLPSAYQEMNSK